MLKLYNYYQSAYGRIVVIILTEKGLPCEREEINPFAEDISPEYLKLHPFKRVPVLQHDDFILYETRAIAEYLEEQFPTPSLVPDDPISRARMRQIISLIDNYGYWPMVREVYVEHNSLREERRKPDPKILKRGLNGSEQALDALEALTSESSFIVGMQYSLADAHLVPMMDYFTLAESGRLLLQKYPKLSRWWAQLKIRNSTISSRPAI
jgi:glutathione S-transferase